MAVYSFEWKYGPGGSAVPAQLPIVDDITYYEIASSTFKKGYPLAPESAATTSSSVVFGANTGVGDSIVFLANHDAVNSASNVDLRSLRTGTAAPVDLPLIVRPGDVFSVTASAAGANTATTVAMIGKAYDWVASTESGETGKAVINTSGTTYKQFLVIGLDDRDALGTSGGRLLVMYIGGAALETACGYTA